MKLGDVSRVVALLAVCTAPSRADDDLLSLSLSGCDDLSESALREHLKLELRTLGLGAKGVQLQLRCQGSDVVEIAAGEPPVVTRVALLDTERGARERLVALSASELVAQLAQARPDLAAAPVADPPPAAKKRNVAAPSPARARRESSNELSAAASVALQGSPRTTLWGGALAARLGFGQRWALLLDGRFESGTEVLTLAQVDSTSLSGLAGLAARAHPGPLEISAGLGVRAGWLSLSAEARAPDRGQSLKAPWAGVALPLRVAWSSSSWRPFVGLEAGFVTLPVRGTVNGDERLVDNRGTWLAASLGLGLGL